MIKEYQSAYSDPINIRRGEKVTITKKDCEYKGWLWCIDQSGKQGWVPERFLDIQDENTGIVGKDYDSTELTVNRGQSLRILVRESEWLWCETEDGARGWIPEESVEIQQGCVDNHLSIIRDAYDLTVEEHSNGIDPMDKVPRKFKNTRSFKQFVQECSGCNSGAVDIKQYLDPQPGMRFLDAGCCANLASYRLDRWPSTYFGVDISPRLIKAMQGFVEKNNLEIGGLWVGDLASLPFEDHYFDICMIIGVLEYFDLDYVQKALEEICRVLKSGARLVLDIPNLNHHHYPTMLKLEQYLGRPHPGFRRDEFEDALASISKTVRVDDSRVMIKYFLQTVG